MPNSFELDPFIAQQSASAPISTNLLRDEYDAVATVEKDATGEQRVVAVGNSIPLVYGKFQENVGGVWVSPPAARYGLRLTDTLGDSFALGLVISDGEIGSISIDDIYKGAFSLKNISGATSAFAYGTMPTSGYDYTFSTVSTVPGTPAIPATPATVIPGTAPVYEYRERVDNDAKIQTTIGLSFVSFYVAKLSFTVKVEDETNTQLPFLYTFSRGSRTIATSGVLPSNAVTSISLSDDNGYDSASYTLRIDRGSVSAWQGRKNIKIKINPYSGSTFLQVLVTPGTPSVTIPGTPGAPAVPISYNTVGLPLSPGSGGSFAGLSCLAVRGTYTVEAKLGDYKEQVRCFVRNGVRVADILTGGIGSSSNFLNLAYYLLKVNNVPDYLIDIDSFKEAYKFTERNRLFFNGVVNNPVNLRDYLARVAPGFLLRFVQIDGKFAFKPVLPVLSNGDFNASTIFPAKSFDATQILNDTYEKTYYPSQQRKPICVLVTWREQLSQPYSLNTTTEIRYTGTALNGPFEQYDFSDFVTNSIHSELVGKYILASRKHITHSVSFVVAYDAESPPGEKLVAQLQPMDIIRITRAGVVSSAGSYAETAYYQVASISETAAGQVTIEANHFPTDAGGASLIAGDIALNPFVVL
jgi:hypothetical protein